MNLLLPLASLPPICLAVFGVAWIIADSKISLPVRRRIAAAFGEDSFFLTLLECPPCLSFWLGFGMGLVLGYPIFTTIVLAPICTATSLLFWSHVERPIQ